MHTCERVLAHSHTNHFFEKRITYAHTRPHIKQTHIHRILLESMLMFAFVLQRHNGGSGKKQLCDCWVKNIDPKKQIYTSKIAFITIKMCDIFYTILHMYIHFARSLIHSFDLCVCVCISFSLARSLPFFHFFFMFYFLCCP